MDADLNEYEDAILFAVTPENQCVGIKIFHESNLQDVNDNVVENVDDYIDRCFQSATDLKTSIKKGEFDINDPKIVPNPKTNCINIQDIINQNIKNIKQCFALKQENLFIDLETVRTDRAVNTMSYGICLGEIRTMQIKGFLTPLILKRDPQIVHWVRKLCQYSEQDGRLSAKSRNIRKSAIKTIDVFKTVLEYDGRHEEFLTWFFKSANLFQQLTKHLSDEQRTQVTVDPEIEFFKQSIV